jgi:flagellar motor switch protein FliN
MSENKPVNPSEQNAATPGTPGGGAAAATTMAELRSIQPGALPKGATQTGKPLDLEFLLDIPLQVRVEVGRTKLLIQELLQLGKGSVIELSKLLGEPFEVMVNEKLVARGEVVVVNDRFGVRLTDIISPHERVQSLG